MYLRTYPGSSLTTIVDACASKFLLSTRDTLFRSTMGGAILAIAAAFAVTITVTNSEVPGFTSTTMQVIDQ